MSNVAGSSQQQLDNAQHLYKCWAAIRGESVILTISMRVPNDVDFESFRSKAISTLDLVGDVKTGDLYEMDGEEYFLPRPDKHQNRSKKKPKAEIKPLRLSKDGISKK